MRSIRYFTVLSRVDEREFLSQNLYLHPDEDKNIVLDKLATLFEEQYDYWIDRYQQPCKQESFKLEPPSLIYSGTDI